MTILTSTMRMQLDAADFVKNAKQLAEVLDKDVKRIDALKAALKETGGSDRLQASMVKLGASTSQVEGVRRALEAFRKEQGLVGKSWGDLTKEQKAALRTFESATVATVRTIIGEEKDLTAAVKREAEQRSAALLMTEQKLREQILAQDAKAENRRIAMLAVAAGEKSEAVRREVAVRAAIEAEITARLRTEVRARVAASQEEALTIERIAQHEKELRVRAIEAETTAIVAARHRQTEAEAHAMQHAQDRAGFRHFALTGIAAGVSAHGVVSAGEKVAEAGAERQSQRILMKNAGISPAEIVRIEDQAMRLSTMVGNVSQTKVMETAQELRSMIADPAELGKVLDPIIRAKSVLDAMDTTGGSSEGIGQLLKAGELVGAAKDPERLTKLIDGWVKVMQVSGKTVNPEQIFEFVKYSKTAGATLSDRFLTTVGPSILQELGGSTTGNDIAMMSKTLATGFGKNHTSMREAARIGLINPDDIDYLKTGEAKGLKPGREHAVRGDTLFQTDPDKWVYEVLVPHMEAAGIKTQEAQIAFVQKTFTGTSADFIAKTITQRQAYDTHAENYGRAAGLGAIGTTAQGAAVGLTSLTTAISNLSANVSVAAMEPIGVALNNAAGWINKLAEVAKDHPIPAATIGAGVGAAALAGSGYLSWKVLGGMQVSAARTQVAAAEMQLAAAEKAAGGGVIDTLKKALPAVPALGAGSLAVVGAGIVAAGGVAGAMNSGHAGEFGEDAGTWGGDGPAKDPPGTKSMWGKAWDAVTSKFSVGGYTGNGGRNEPAGIVHRGEFVLNASATARHRALIEAIHAGTIDLPGYAMGGGVGLQRIGGGASGVVPVSLATDSSSASALREVFFDAMYEALKQARDEGDASGGDGSGGAPNLRYGNGGASAGLPSLRYGHASGGHGYRDAPEHGGRPGHYRNTPGHERNTPDGPGHAGDVKGGEAMRAMAAMNYLVDKKGWTPEGAAEAVGNAMQESQVSSRGGVGDPNVPGGSHKMFQWNNGKNNDTVNGRWARFQAFAKAQGKSVDDFETNLDFMDEERKRRSGLEAQWHKQTDLHNAGRLSHLYEGYGDNSEGTRVQNARDILARYRQRAAEQAVLPKKPPTASAAPGPMSQADPMSGGVALDHSSIREATHHVRELKRELASLGTASVNVSHRGFGDHGGHAPGAVRTALNGNFGSDGRWS